MCGIVAAVAKRNVIETLLEGLRRLEYRGYDSCGLALSCNGELLRSRSTARVADLRHQVEEAHLAGFMGIAHTRWATHGVPATSNAHPHFSRGRIALVHNGIIENFEELRAELQAAGYVFESQTDTEVIAHLIERLYQGDLLDAVRAALLRLRGAYAIAVIARDEPHRIVGARLGSPLVVGRGDGENFLASDAMAVSGVTDRIIYLEDGDVVDLQLQGVWIFDAEGNKVTRETRIVHAHTGSAELGPYRHFMQKEIFEQPRAVSDTLEGVDAVFAEIFGDGAFKTFESIDKVLILARACRIRTRWL
jgi:glucosamine--fructose-6-phosphate aminotransferase (isomerizing)